MVDHGWCTDGTLRLHYLTTGDAAQLTPLIYVPGALGAAEDFRPEMERLSPRPTIAISPRGFGLSSSPERGYGFDDRVRDLETVSLGVPIALRYAVRNPRRVAGLILLDYPAVYPAFATTWSERALPQARQRGIPEHVVLRMQLESQRTELWDELAHVRAPVLIVKGGKSSAISPEDLERFRSRLPQARIEIFADAGHEVFRPDYERFMHTVEAFLDALDASA